MEALDQLLMACHSQSIKPFVESFLHMVAKLLESREPDLQVLGTNSVRQNFQSGWSKKLINENITMTDRLFHLTGGFIEFFHLWKDCKLFIFVRDVLNSELEFAGVPPYLNYFSIPVQKCRDVDLAFKHKHSEQLMALRLFNASLFVKMVTY